MLTVSQIEDMNSQAQASAAQQLASAGGAGAGTLETVGAGGDDDDDDDIPDLEAPEDDGPVDETGVDPKDVDLVMAQVSCSRAKAVRVLKESSGDLINASTSFVLYMVLNLTRVPSHGGQRMISSLRCTIIIVEAILFPIDTPVGYTGH